VIDACREHGFRSVNIDLISGLPRQTVDRFRQTLDTVIAARPDRLAVYGYAHLPAFSRRSAKFSPTNYPMRRVG
jgi:oxygen-independent coproporphyrinogen-3 oxidase